MSDTRPALAAYWAAAETRDWDAFGALLAEDVRYELPQSRERVRGRAAYVRFNSEGFAGDWHVVVERIVAAEHEAASIIRFTDTNGSQQGICFFRFDERGLIAGITDYWPEPYEPSPGRAHLVERYFECKT